MTATETCRRLFERNKKWLAQIRANAVIPERPINGPRVYLQAAHQLNLVNDCSEREVFDQTDDTVALPVVPVYGAIARCETVGGAMSTLSILKDRATTVYLNFKTLSESNRTVTLVELSQRGNIIDPLVLKNVEVLAFSPSSIAVKLATLIPHARYGVLATYRAVSLPKCREFLNSVSLMAKDDHYMSPLVSAFVHYAPGQVIRFPLASPAWQLFGIKYVFTHKQSPPGSGKTWKLIDDVISISAMPNQTIFVIGPTNEVVLEICGRLASRAVKYNVSLSDVGLAKRLDVDKSNNMAKCTVQWGVERFLDSKTFASFSRTFSNIYVMTINKMLSPKWEANGFFPTTVLWDEITLSTTGTFYSVLNKNPSNMITYGDEKQGTPFVAASYDDDYGVLRSPINLFGIPGSLYHHFIKRAVRMPNPYGEFFLQFFYDLRCNAVLLNAFPDFVRHFNLLDHYTAFVARHPCQADGGEFRGMGTSWLNDMYEPGKIGFSLFTSKCAPTMVVTPYIAQATLLRKRYAFLRALTLRPAQGQQSEHVMLDFVRGDYSPFFTNTSMVVAMSRFQSQFTVSFVPRLPDNFAMCLAGFDYKDLQTVSDNYDSFVNMFNANRIRNMGLFPDSFSAYDHNNDFFLKWWFFLACAERLWVQQSSACGIPIYNYEMTSFKILRELRFN